MEPPHRAPDGGQRRLTARQPTLGHRSFELAAWSGVARRNGEPLNWGSQSARSRLLIDACADGPGGVYQGACGGGGVMPIPAVACMLTV